MSPAELVSLVCCDLGAIVRGRDVFSAELDGFLDGGIGWVPANHALTPLGPLAEPNPFGSTGDLRLLPDADTHVRVGGQPDDTPLELVLCDIVELDGTPWSCCPRRFLRDALDELRRSTSGTLLASFEHEFQLLRDEPPALPFSLEALRRAAPFGTSLMAALVEAGCEPERFFAEFAGHQYEVPVAPTEGIAAADRAVVLREVVKEVARRTGGRASFVPLLDPNEAGNGVHVHISLLDENGSPLLHDASRPGSLSELGGSFAAGILRHGRALSALCAPSPVSGERLKPHHWSAGALCLAERNREALLRIPPVVALPRSGGAARQLRLEFRGADASANPHLALGAIVRAGLEGVKQGLPAPAMLDRDPATLQGEELERFGVGALPETLGEALEALEDDAVVRGWMEPLLYEAYVSLKHAEVAATAGVSLEESCRLYANAY